MLAIRFNRIGKKNQVAFRIALQEKGRAPGRKHVEMLGSYDPHMKQSVLKKDRILYWIAQGAQPSDSVHNLFVREGLLADPKRAIKMEKPAVKEEPAPEAEALVAEKGVAEEVAEAPKEAAAEVAPAPVETVTEEKAA